MSTSSVVLHVIIMASVYNVAVFVSFHTTRLIIIKGMVPGVHEVGEYSPTVLAV